MNASTFPETDDLLVQGAVDWLDKNQDKSIEDIKEEATNQGEGDGEAGEEPKSLKCDDCGKRFRYHSQAEYHATKTYIPSLESLPIMN